MPVAKEEWEYLINPITMHLLGAMGCLGISLYPVSLPPGVHSELFALPAPILPRSPARHVLPSLLDAPLFDCQCLLALCMIVCLLCPLQSSGSPRFR